METCLKDNDVPASQNEEENGRNLKKCIRKGDTIYYSKPENINIFRNNIDNVVISDNATKSSLETNVQTDKVLSGESLYKTFTFEQSTNDEETEKCIAFWRSVMEKNLAPIKCALIENQKKRQQPVSEEKETSFEAVSEKSLNENQLQDEIRKVHEQYRNMWLGVLKEIQKKRLHEIKLIGKTRCDLCDSISSSVDEFPCMVDKTATRKEIKELNNWKTTSRSEKIDESTKELSKNSISNDDKDGIKEADIQNDGITQMNNEEIERILTSFSNESNEENENNEDAAFLRISWASPETKIKNEMTSWASLSKKNTNYLEPDTKTYKFVNAIEEKKNGGVYSKWRSNALKGVCQCQSSTCNCNMNPAVLSIESEVPIPIRPQRSALKNCMEEPPVNAECYVPQQPSMMLAGSVNSVEIHQKRLLTRRKSDSYQRIDTVMSGSLRPSLKKTSVKKPPLIEEQEVSEIRQPIDECYVPQQPSRSRAASRNSLEIHRRRLSSKSTEHSGIMLYTRKSESQEDRICDNSNQHIKRKLPSISFKAAQTSESPSESDLTVDTSAKMNRKKSSSIELDDFRKDYEPDKNLSQEKLKFRTVSLMIKTCTCTHEDCDCFKKEELKHEKLSQAQLDEYIPKPKSKPGLKKVNSINLIKRRLSTAEEAERNESGKIIYSAEDARKEFQSVLNLKNTYHTNSHQTDQIEN